LNWCFSFGRNRWLKKVSGLISAKHPARLGRADFGGGIRLAFGCERNEVSDNRIDRTGPKGDPRAGHPRADGHGFRTNSNCRGRRIEKQVTVEP
jgi:hypothetical protein